MLHRKSIGIGVLGILIGISVFWIIHRRGTPIVDRNTPTFEIPDIVLHRSDGVEIPFSQFKGTSTVVTLWASWCKICILEMQKEAILQKEFGDQVVMVFVNRGESPDAVRHSIDAVGTTGYHFLFDPSDALYKTVGGYTMPEMLFIDASGIIRFHTRGLMEEEEIRRRMQDIFGT